MADERVYYLVMRLMSWDDVELQGGPWPVGPLRVSAELPSHFLPVFDALEAANAWTADGKHRIERLTVTQPRQPVAGTEAGE